MVALKILMLNKFKNHPKRAMGKFIPSISHNYSTVDPSCEVIAKILQWLSGHVFFGENSRVRGHIGPLYCESLFCFRLQLEVAMEFFLQHTSVTITLHSRTCAVISQKFCSGHTATGHRGIR